jgi:hypothetical protein
MLIPWDQEEILERIKLRKSVLGLKPGNGGFCILEIKNNRRMSLRPKLFVSTRRLQKQRPKPRKTVLDSSPGEDVFCSSETKHDRRTAQRTKLFVSAKRLQELGHKAENFPGFESQWRFFYLGIMVIIITMIFSMIFSHTYRMILPMTSFRAIKIDRKCKHLSNFPAVTLREFC